MELQLEILQTGCEDFDMEKLSKQEQLKRKSIVEEALSNARLEGYSPSVADIEQWNAYVNGRQTLEETVRNLQQSALSNKQ